MKGVLHHQNCFDAFNVHKKDRKTSDTWRKRSNKENGLHLRKWVTVGILFHTLKRWVTLGNMGHMGHMREMGHTYKNGQT